MRGCATLALAGLAACSDGSPTKCGNDGGGAPCPVNNFCLFGQCQAPGQLSDQLAILVRPNDPALSVQEFSPADLQALLANQPASQTALFALQLDRPAQLNGTVLLPDGCSPATGYPVHFHFEALSFIPPVPLTFDCDTDPRGQLLPGCNLPTRLDYSERVSTATPCAAPILRNFPVSRGGPISVGDTTHFAALASSYRIVGQIRAAGAVGPTSAKVRLLGLGSANFGQAISNDAIVEAPAGGSFALTIDSAQSPVLTSDGGCLPGTPGCTPTVALWLETLPSISPSPLPVVDLQVAASLATDDAGQIVSLLGDAGLTLPVDLDPQALQALEVRVDADGGPLIGAEVLVTAVDGGVFGCGLACRFVSQSYTNDGGAVSFAVPPGSYAVAVQPLPPLGAAFAVAVAVDGGLFLPGDGGPAGPFLRLTTASPFPVSGAVVGPDGQAISGGEVELLSLPDLLPVALQALVDSQFELFVPPGFDYLLLVSPERSSQLPTFFKTLSVPAPQEVNQTIKLDTPGQLAGQVEVTDLDGGFLLPVPAAEVEAYFLLSDPNTGRRLAFPVASTITDAQGNWEAPGPPPGSAAPNR